MEECEYNNLNVTNDDDVNIMSMNNTGNGFNHDKQDRQSPSNLTKGNVFNNANGNGKVHNQKKLSNNTDDMGDNIS